MRGERRDQADQNLDNVQTSAYRAAATMIALGIELESSRGTDYLQTLTKVRKPVPEVNTRVHKSYSRLLTATMMVRHVPITMCLICLVYDNSVVLYSSLKRPI